MHDSIFLSQIRRLGNPQKPMASVRMQDLNDACHIKRLNMLPHLKASGYGDVPYL